jgi:hypothetical protein
MSMAKQQQFEAILTQIRQEKLGGGKKANEEQVAGSGEVGDV